MRYFDHNDIERKFGEKFWGRIEIKDPETDESKYVPAPVNSSIWREGNAALILRGVKIVPDEVVELDPESVKIQAIQVIRKKYKKQIDEIADEDRINELRDVHLSIQSKEVKLLKLSQRKLSGETLTESEEEILLAGLSEQERTQEEAIEAGFAAITALKQQMVDDIAQLEGS